MPRRSILSTAERESLLALPDAKDDLIRYYTFSDNDLSVIRQHRGPANRLGFAVQLCYLRFPGVILGADELPFPPLLRIVASQLKVPVESWDDYGQREQTRREHLVELQTVFGFQPFTMSHYRQAVHTLIELALQTDKGIVLASALIEHLRRQSIILPALNAIERASAEAITRANRHIYETLSEPLSNGHRHRLDELLKRRDNGKTTWLAWLRQSPIKPNSRHMLEHIERLKAWQALDLPSGIERAVHQNRLLKIAREGGQMTPADLAKFEPQRRYATLVALAIEGMATVTDEIIDLHDRILGKLFNAAKNKHQQQFQASGKAINAKVRLFGRIGQALIEAKQAGRDPFAAIEAVMSWDAFAESVTEAQKLAQPEDFDFLHRIGESYATLRRYAPEFLDVLKLRAAPAAKNVLDAIELLRDMNTDNARKVPADAPTAFIKPRWQKLVMSDTGIDRRYYELCALSELKNSLRSGDIWVQGSRQFKDFEDYLVPPAKFASLKQSSELPLAVATDCEQYLHDRLAAAPAVIDQVRQGNIKHFFLVGGCDGDKRERSYYEEFTTSAPKDSVILTLACGKYRFNKKQFGDINGIPRLIDIGQCNDSYSAIQLALALAKEFDCDVNDLPLTLVLSWFEQKAIVVLLTLLSLGIKNIRVGPSIPGFLTENLVSILHKEFGLTPISTVEADLKSMLQAA